MSFVLLVGVVLVTKPTATKIGMTGHTAISKLSIAIIYGNATTIIAMLKNRDIYVDTTSIYNTTCSCITINLER